MTTPLSHEEERHAHAEFASNYGQKRYRTRLVHLYAAWRKNNEQFFKGELLEPHLAIGRTASRNLGHCSVSTDYGGQVQITLNSGLVFGTNTDWVFRRWPPAKGTGRFLRDLLLRFIVRHYVLEKLKDPEAGYRGFGPEFVQQANQIGEALGLTPVVARRRGGEGREPVANGWPHCVRPEGYYGDDITAAALELACGRSGKKPLAAASYNQGLLELVLHLIGAGRAEDSRRMVMTHLEWLRAASPSRWPRRKHVEAGVEDVDGTPLGGVAWHAEWVRWNGGTVARMAQSIHQARSFTDLPLLADALEAAGCDDRRILGHLRERMQHGRNCWVLHRVLALATEGSIAEQQDTTSSAVDGEAFRADGSNTVGGSNDSPTDGGK